MWTGATLHIEKLHKPGVKQEDAAWTKEIYFVCASLITTKGEHKHEAELICTSYIWTIKLRAAVRWVMLDQESFFVKFPRSLQCLQSKPKSGCWSFRLIFWVGWGRAPWAPSLNQTKTGIADLWRDCLQFGLLINFRTETVYTHAASVGVAVAWFPKSAVTQRYLCMFEYTFSPFSDTE